MTPLARISSTATIATLMATPIMADVSADDVWTVFTDYYQAVGLKLEASESRSGNRLSISDLKISAKFPFDLGSLVITTIGFALIENADGTVEMKLPDNMPLAMALSLPDDIFATATMDYRVSGYHAVASGVPENITIKSGMDSVVMTLGDVSVSGAKLPEFDLNVTATMRDIFGETTFGSGDMIALSQDYTFGGMIFEGNYSGQDENGADMAARFNSAIAQMQSSSTMAVPATGIDLMNLPAQLHQGLSLKTSSIVQHNTSEQVITLDGQIITEQKTAIDNATTLIAISGDGVTLKSEASAYAIDYVMAELPFPIKVAFTTFGAHMHLPLLKSDADQDYTYALDLDGMVMDDGIWNLFDPEAKLPRDPARFKLDITGKARLFFDLLDYQAMKQVIDNGTKFGEITALNLNSVDIMAIGARLTGNGAFSFDNSDLETFGGMPAPNGDARFEMAGLNGALDTLITMGLIENDAAFGMRMGLGLVAVPGDGEDTLVSDISVRPDGQISANGKRIK